MKIKCLLLSFFIASLLTTNAYAEKFIVTADEWCPYNCEEDAADKGFMVEIAEAILSEHGYEVEYKVVPWTRAIKMVESNIYQGLIASTPAETPAFKFPENIQAFNSYVAYTKSDSNWEYAGVDSFKGKALGVISDYGYGEEIDSYIEANSADKTAVQAIGGENAMEQNLKKLAAGRIDIYIENQFVVDNYYKSQGETNPFRDAGWVGSKNAIENEYLYIAISPKHPKSDEIAKLLSDGMVNLRNSGKLQKILDKYGVKDWFAKAGK